MAHSQQARENQEYVRRLLKERQPEFAAALEAAEQELRLEDRLGLLRPGLFSTCRRTVRHRDGQAGSVRGPSTDAARWSLSQAVCSLKWADNTWMTTTATYISAQTRQS